jgi:hypothetical protein
MDNEPASTESPAAAALEAPALAVTSFEPSVEAGTAPESASAPRPGFLDQARAMVTEKAGLLAENRTMRAELGSFRAENARLTEQVTALTTERDRLAAEAAAATDLLSQAQERDRTLGAAVTDELAALGVPSTDLPASSATPGQTDRERITEEFAVEQDPLRKAQLARQLRDIKA